MLILVFAALSASPVAPPCAQCLAPGTVVVGVTCDASDPTQQGWAFDTAAGHITHVGLCLSVTAWGVPLNLYSCGNKTTHQTFAFDTKSRHFEIQAPANTPTLYPADLEIVKGPGIQKAYVYRPSKRTVRRLHRRPCRPRSDRSQHVGARLGHNPDFNLPFSFFFLLPRW